ncbi:MAG: extracellular solute-binding protein [Provencibacterium sp.]|jgi:putative aldouronate transport system substrate-binding protein|nr:extracellular solute-binding protein [Provencibacterium sp.]
MMMRKMLATLLAAGFLLGTTACSTQDGSASSPQLSAGSPSASASSAAPSDGAQKVITVLGNECNHLVLQDAQKTEIYQVLMDMFAEHGVEIDMTSVVSDQYLTVLQAQIASGNMPDYFDASPLSAPNRINLITTGKLMAIDDVLPYSNGTAFDALAEGGYYNICRKKDTYEDGKLYYIGNVNMLPSVNNGKFGYTQMDRNTFTIKIRQDWLDKVGMEMPQTIDDFYRALEAFQQQDVNGNGVADERLAVQTDTCNTTWGGFFDNGIAQWFGLAPYVFNMDYQTGQCMVPFLQEGFIPYVEFMKKCVDNGLLYLGTDIGKNNTGITTALTQNVVSAYFFPANSDQASSNDPDEIYAVMPIIQGAAGIDPVMEGSRGYKSWDYHAFSSNVDPQAAAAFLDVIISLDYSKWYFMGVEGQTCEVVDGLYRYTGPTTAEEVRSTGWGSGEYVVRSTALSNIQLHGIFSTYKGEALLWDSFDDYLNSAYYQEVESQSYKEHYKTNIVTWCENAKKLNMYNMNSDLAMICPMATEAEAEIIDQYKDDLYTYMDELFANLVNGTWAVSDYEAYKAKLYELGLQEMIDVYQSQYDRIQD